MALTATLKFIRSHLPQFIAKILQSHGSITVKSNNNMVFWTSLRSPTFFFFLPCWNSISVCMPYHSYFLYILQQQPPPSLLSPPCLDHHHLVPGPPAWPPQSTPGPCNPFSTSEPKQLCVCKPGHIPPLPKPLPRDTKGLLWKPQT